jgi:hypothetical protein
MFLNIAILPHIREDLLREGLRSRPGLLPVKVADGRLADIDTHQTLIMSGGCAGER